MGLEIEATGFAFDAVPYFTKYSSAVRRSNWKLRAPSEDRWDLGAEDEDIAFFET